jgi:hypothetical protein
MDGFPVINPMREESVVSTEQTTPAIIETKEPQTSLHPLPETLKNDNWQLYVLSRSNDPSVQVPNTRKLLSNLVNSAKIMYGVRDVRLIPDKTLVCDLIRSIAIVSDAWYEYSDEKNWGYAAAECEKVLDSLGDLLYDPKWSTGKKDSFVASGKK